MPLSIVEEKRNDPWIINRVATHAGQIPVVKTELTWADRRGHYRVRWNIGREKFQIQPGLYGVGTPDKDSPVFVSANYKMSFDILRSNLNNINGWILVLDTKGINVWCAAGKGTFGTDELVHRVKSTSLELIVNHRKLIIPQLGATGVAAHLVKEQTGFQVKFGPVRAKDIPAYLENKMRATPEMRKVRYNLRDRLVIIPNDLVQYLKYVLPIMIATLILTGLRHGSYTFGWLTPHVIIDLLFMLGLYALGSILSQGLLPWLPGRPFAVKGIWVGLILSSLVYLYTGSSFNGPTDIVVWIGVTLGLTALFSFQAMNYTGCSTFTSLSGVKREMKIAVPLQIVALVIGLAAYIVGRILEA